MATWLALTALHARQTLRRHLRSPAIWAVGLATPIAARFMLPGDGAGYGVLTVNGGVPDASAANIGLQVGVVSAVLLAPLAYVFLRAGPTRTQPVQVTDVAPGPRVPHSVGQWLGDTAMLALIVLALALAAALLSAFRLPRAQVAPLQTALVVVLIATPALAIIAALRRLLAARPSLRTAWGDVVFAVTWMALLVVSIAGMSGAGGLGSALPDVFGFASPVALALGERVEELVIFGPAATGEPVALDAMSGVLDPAFLLSRAVWLIVAASVAALGGLLYKGGRPKVMTVAPAREAIVFTETPVTAVAPTPSVTTRALAHAHDMVRPAWLAIPVVAASLAAIIAPFDTVSAPALGLLLIFPMSAYGARWRGTHLASLLDTLPEPQARRFALRLAVAVAIGTALVLPGVLMGGSVVLAALVGVVVPVVSLGLGWLSRTAVAARLLLLIGWYAALSMG